MSFLGISILFLPFLFLFFFENKHRAFLYIFTVSFAFHLCLAFFAQFFGFFSYNIMLVVSMCALCTSIITVLYLKRKICSINVPLYILIGFILIFIQLWTVHYNYSGPVSTILGVESVQSSSYPYPMFSDEWVAAAWIKYSISTGELPFINPFKDNIPFANLLFPFHVFLSQFFLLTQLDPVENYAVVPIIFGFLICLVAYSMLRVYEVGKISSLLAVLCIPLISQSGNLPGIWFAIPYILGFLFFMIFLGGIKDRDFYLYSLSSLLSFVFYPPMLVFLLPAYCVYFIKNKKKLVIVLSVMLLPVLFYPDLVSKIIRPNLDGGIISFPVHYVIPIILIPIILLGGYILCKKKNLILLAPVCLGLCYWVFYSFYPKVLIIEYPRIVMITAILLVLVAGFGFSFFENILSKKISKTLILTTFVFITLYYPINDNWKMFVTRPFSDNETGTTMPIIPNAPIMRHLTLDDIALFSDIHDTTFIAPPWKGLVLGVLTNNKPLESKASTIATNTLKYKDFMNAGCDKKLKYIKRYDITHVYSASLDCLYFKIIGRSSEELNLYKIEIN